MIRIVTLFCVIWLFTENTLSAQRLIFEYDTAKIIRLDSTFNSSEKSEMRIYFDRLHKKISQKMSVNIGKSKEKMSSDLPERALSNFLTDKLYEYGDAYLMKQKGKHADMSLLNKGGIRTHFPKGDITVGNVFETLPFDNTVVIIALKGYELEKILLKIDLKNGHPLSRVEMSLDSVILVNGKQIEKERVYHLVTVDFIMLNGDDIISENVKYENFYNTKKLFRNVIIEQIKQITKEGKLVENVINEKK